MSTRYQHAIFCVSGSIWGLHALRRTRTLQGIATLNSCPGRNGHSYEAALLREVGRCLGVVAEVPGTGTATKWNMSRE
jgi:hypothetical protein